MRITKIVRGYGKNINLGNYESARFFASLEAEVAEDDDIKKVSQMLKNGVKKLVDDDIKKYKG